MSVRKASSHSSRAGPSGKAEISARALRIWPAASAWARLAEAYLGRLAPVLQRPVADVRLGVVVGEHLGLVPRQVGKPTLERLGDAPVQVALPRLQDGLVGRVPDERMLEAVHCIRRLAALRDDIGLDELFEGGRERRRARADTTAPTSSNENSCPMIDAASATSLAGPSRSSRATRLSCSVAGMTKDAPASVETILSVALLERAGRENRPRDLLDEQRNPCALATICSTTDSGSVTPAAVLSISSLTCRRPSWLSVSSVTCAQPEPGRSELRPEIRDHHRPEPATRRRIRPISSIEVGSAQ